MGHWIEVSLQWNFQWFNRVQESQGVEELVDLVVLLDIVQPDPRVHDTFDWACCHEKIFRIKTCYMRMMQEKSTEKIDKDLNHVMKKIWKTKVPSKIKLFC